MTNPAAREREANSRVELVLIDAVRSPAESLDLITYWGMAWLFTTPWQLILAVLLGLVAATARSSNAHRTLIVVSSKVILLLGTAILLFLVGALNLAYAYGPYAAISWLDWVAVFVVTLIATVVIHFGVRPIPRDRAQPSNP